MCTCPSDARSPAVPVRAKRSCPLLSGKGEIHVRACQLQNGSTQHLSTPISSWLTVEPVDQIGRHVLPDSTELNV
jgi:hypothetical protein